MQIQPIVTRIIVGSLLIASATYAIGAPPEYRPTAIVIDETRVTVAETMQQDAALGDICFVDHAIGWAVGDRGVIWHTTDAGRSWHQQTSGVACRLNSVCFVDSQHGWAAGGVLQPYTHGTRGIVLVTADGGTTWIQLPQPTLPGIARIEFFDPRHGIAAGSGSAAEPSGVYATRDGGKSWEPLPADGQGLWLAADFIDANSGAVAGPAGQFAALMRRRVVHGPAAMALTRSYRALRLAPPASGWLVGDGGLVMTTRDLGHSWQTPPGELPPVASEHFDFHAVATIGPQVWIAGSPGSRVFHSADEGHTWQTFDTNQPLPIRALAFVDANTGWAVGELGTILATSDGGRAWQVQRQGGRRAALMAVFARDTDVPLEALTKYGAEGGYLAAVEIVHPTGDPLAAARTADAMKLAGATSAQAAWRFPLAGNDYSISPEDLLATLNRTNDGRALQRLEEHVVRQLRMWRPDVLITRHAEDKQDDPMGALVEQLVARSVVAAADPVQFPQLAADVGLPAWQTKQVFGLLPVGSRGDVRVSAGEFAPRLGQSLADAAAPARELLYTAPKTPPDTTNLAWLNRASADSARPSDLFSEIRLAPGSEARRRLANLPDEDMVKLRQLAARRRQMQVLLDRSRGNAAWDAQIANLTDGLDAASGGDLLFQLADGYRASGRLDLAADTYSALARLWPEHSLVDPALRWLVQFYASSEAAHRLAKHGATNIRQADGPDDANAVRQASAVSNPMPVVGLARDDRLRRAATLGQYLESARPAMFAEPSVRFPLVVAQRQLGLPNHAKRYFLTLHGRSENDPWRRCSDTEEWFANSEGLPPPKKLGTCRRTGDRPHLDGQFTEPLWESADRLRLRGSADDSQTSSDVRFVYDGEFLYVAISCPKSAGDNHAPDNRPRPRDANLARHDRVTLCFDVDRDYTTAFELTVDQRGWTHDACWGDATWNPAWFVAAGGGTATWTVEAAIPLAELVPEPPAAKHVWAVAVERTAPGGAVESWAGDGVDAKSPDRFGLLIFE
jgi:photosystem II stability/assembly factor-like uncharacterized protein